MDPWQRHFTATTNTTYSVSVHDVDLSDTPRPWFDFAVNEECHGHSERGVYAEFTGKDKPVFIVEYNAIWRSDATGRSKLCIAARDANLRTLVLQIALDDCLRVSCD